MNTNPPWQYDEAKPVGADYRDRAEVAAYDLRMQKLRDIEAEIQAVKTGLALKNNSSVWEIGTGTGECALGLASCVRQVYATDVSLAMLEYARQKARRRKIINVKFEAGGFLSGFRPPSPVDGVVSQLALHHLPDFWKMQALIVIAGSLRSSGRFYLRDVVFPASADHAVFFEETIDCVRRQAGDETARQTIQHIKTEFSTLDWILESMIDRSGLKIVEKDCDGFLSVYICEK